MHLSVFLEHHEVESVAVLRTLLVRRHKGKYGAFWLSKTRDGCPALALFINEEQACLFYIPEEGDPGIRSLGSVPDNFNYQIDFLIDNYQLDQYPLAMVIPTAKALTAFEEFFSNAALPASISWHE